jgi:hypothetical protein
MGGTGVRNTAANDGNDDSAVSNGESGLVRAVLPFVRPLLLAGAVTVLIMVGLPAFLAIASASVR